MKKIFINIIIVITMIIGLGNICFAEDTKKAQESVDSYIEEQLNKLNIEDIQEYINDGEIIEDVNLKSFIKDLIKGEKTLLDLFNVDKLKTLFLNEFKTSLRIAVIILVIALLSSVLKSLDNSFSSGAITQITTYIVFISMVSLTLIGFKDVLSICNTTLEGMIDLMQVVVPILVALLAVMGFPITSTILHPLFLGFVTFLNMIFKNFVFVSITVAFVILIVNNLSKNIKLKKFASFIKQVNLVVIGGTFILYLGAVSIQGLYVRSIDAFAVKTAKFAVGNFIPIVGGFVSDSVDMLLSSSEVIKNLFGGVGLILLVGICAIPILKVISIILVYKFSAIVVEPIGEDSISNFLNEIANLMMIMLGCIIAVTVMFFVTLAVLTSIGLIAS